VNDSHDNTQTDREALERYGKRPMRVLVACEFSGVVRDAFRAKGRDAWSCDLLPSESDPRWHIKGDIRELIVYDRREWDMLIAFPPCTHLAVSGARWWKDKAQAQLDALVFVRWLLELPIPRIALENPVGLISSRIRKPDQIIQPWQFGEDASKKTCLWLKGLPALRPTNILPGGAKARRANQTASGQNRIGPSPDRWKLRSATFPGIAAAMAEQWGSLP
jgi:site-specific DNA-cytosine methylase